MVFGSLTGAKKKKKKKEREKTWIVYFCGKWERNENSKNEEKLLYTLYSIYTLARMVEGVSGRRVERQRERESSTKWTITPSGVHSRHETREIYGTAGIVRHVTGTKKCETIPSPPLALPISRNSDRMVACATPDWLPAKCRFQVSRKVALRNQLR